MAGRSGRRVRARGLRETAKITKPCRPGPLTGRFFKHALRLCSIASSLQKLGAGCPQNRQAETPALVRLRRRWVGAVEVRSHAVKNRMVSNRNCVAATRGGEQWNENDQSVTNVLPGRRTP